MANPLGRTYLFDYDQVQGSNQQQTPSFEAEPSFIEGEKPMNNLEFVEGTTDNYFNSFANLQSFSRTARKRYGIDVTNPDLSDPLQQYMHKAFLKLHAQTAAMGQALQQGKLNRDAARQAQASYADYIPGGEGEGAYGTYEDQGFRSPILDSSKSFANNLTKMFDVQSERNTAERLKQEKLLEINEQLKDQSLKPSERRLLESAKTIIEGASPSTNTDPQRAEPYSFRSGMEREDQLLDVFTRMHNMDEPVLNVLKSGGGVSDARYFLKDGEMHVKLTDTKGITKSIPVRNIESGIDALNGFFKDTFGGSWIQGKVDPKRIQGSLSDEDYRFRENKMKLAGKAVQEYFSSINDKYNKDEANEFIDLLNTTIEQRGSVVISMPAPGGGLTEKAYEMTGLGVKKTGPLSNDKLIYKQKSAGGGFIEKEIKDPKEFVKIFMENNPLLFEEIANTLGINPPPSTKPKNELVFDPNKTYMSVDGNGNGWSPGELTEEDFNLLVKEGKIKQ